MHPPLGLRELQRDLQRHILGEDSHVSDAIVDARPLPALERLAIYKNAYRMRLIDALHASYPVLHGLLGDELWLELGQAFVADHPSPYRSIRWYGSELAEFMSRLTPFYQSPVLSEMATLEWTLSLVFDAADAEAVQRSALTSMDPEIWGGLTFGFHPSLHRLAFRWNTASVWKAMNNDAKPPPPQQSETSVAWLLWRQDLQNYFRSMSPPEAAALDSALRGRTFAEICEDLSELLPEEAVPAAAARFLGAWADSGIIIDVS